MTGDEQLARKAIDRHFETWNNADRAGWLANIDVDTMVFEDPVGSPVKRGRAAIEKNFDAAFRDGQVWELRPDTIIVIGREIAVVLDNVRTVDGVEHAIRSIEEWEIGDDGRMVSCRAFFEQPDDGVIDQYWTTEGEQAE